ncbi:Golgi transport complex subunit 4 [Coemansia sp. RSA 1722]|nr:Golgi transport complex subunit 4 [Coemansia sp. RSA 485]KAJ2588815.1 Golgi transport complex subunit 4 [Coemansia sp. RSA 1722]
MLDLDIGTLSDIAELENAYQLLELEEARIDAEIADGVESAACIDSAFAQLAALQTPLLHISDGLAPVQSVIDATATNAGAISARVRFLDRELASVEQAIRLVADTELLRGRLAELHAAMAAKDIEVAAALIHKYITADASALTSPFVRFVGNSKPGAAKQDAGYTDESPADIISSAAADLVDRVTLMFDNAVSSGNTKDIGRCFRLFPLLGEDLRGLDMYSGFLCSTIAEKARVTTEVSANLYALRITRLFEIAAVIIDNHFPLVETHYGPGRMIRVIQRLHIDVSRRAAMILDFFEDERHIKRRLAQVLQADTKIRPLPKTQIGASLQSASEDASQLSDHDFKEITDILAELVLIQRQIATFNRFMESRATPELKVLIAEGEASKKRIFLAPETVAKLAFPQSQTLPAPGLIDETTGLVTSTQLSARLPWLIESYIAFEIFFVNRSAAKAMLLDDTDMLPGWDEVINDGSDPSFSAGRSGKPGASTAASGAAGSGAVKSLWASKLSAGGSAPTPAKTSKLASTALEHIATTSSCVEDMFFVIKTALEHAISTQQPAAAETVCQLIINVLNSVFISALEARALAKWNSTLPSSSAVSASSAIGPQAASQRSILVSLNNLDLADAYLQRIAESLRMRIGTEWQRVPHKGFIDRAVKALDTVAAFSARLVHAKQRSLEQLGLQLVKPWVRTVLQQSYRDIKYVLTDEEFNDVQNDNLFQKRFVIKFSQLTRQLKRRLTPANFQSVLDFATSSLAADWERAIRQSKFNMLGGIMFEKDVREIQRYLEEQGSGSSLRMKYARLVQMADVLAVEGVSDARHIVEALPSKPEAAAADAGMVPAQAQTQTQAQAQAQAHVSAADIRALLANRIDFSESDIRALAV